MEQVNSFRFLGITKNPSWSSHISILDKKAQKRLYFLRNLKRAKFPCQVLVNVHRLETSQTGPGLEVCSGWLKPPRTSLVPISRASVISVSAVPEGYLKTDTFLLHVLLLAAWAVSRPQNSWSLAVFPYTYSLCHTSAAQCISMLDWDDVTGESSTIKSSVIKPDVRWHFLQNKSITFSHGTGTVRMFAGSCYLSVKYTKAQKLWTQVVR